LSTAGALRSQSRPAKRVNYAVVDVISGITAGFWSAATEIASQKTDEARD
jgi:hypothetical protein